MCRATEKMTNYWKIILNAINVLEKTKYVFIKRIWDKYDIFKYSQGDWT